MSMSLLMKVLGLGYYLNKKWEIHFGLDDGKLADNYNRRYGGRQSRRHVAQQDGRLNLGVYKEGFDRYKSNEEKIMPFYQEIKKVIEREGGYVNDPDDPGGETKYGISKKAYPNVDIENLTVDDAVELYKDDYWLPAKIERLPDKLQGQYFDMVVNQGIAKSSKILQRACNGKNKDKIKVDGKVGPNTIKATARLESDRLRAYRIMEYARLALTRPELEKYYYGWVKRAMHA